jgi:hypothetical protein
VTVGDTIIHILAAIGGITTLAAASVAAIAVITRWSEVSSIREAVTEWGKCHDRLHDRYRETRADVEDLQTRLRKIESTRQYTPPANIDK